MSHFKDELDRFVTEYYTTHGNSGILRVTRKDTILYERFIGFADRESRKPFSKDSMFTLYSLSKPFLVIGLMKLWEKGLIDIDRHPGCYVPEAEGFDRQVTIRHMLHHVSGLPDFEQTAHFSDRYATGHPAELRRQLLELSEYPNVFAPGTDTMYANINMIIPALAIENITGMPYGEYMQNEVFAPLGMTNARVDSPDLILPHRVTGYAQRDGQTMPVAPCLNWMLGAGDIIATVDDVYCLNKAIKGKLLLRDETWAEILKPWPDHPFSMGCRITHWHGKERITHNGGHIGFRTIHIQLPEEDLDIIFLSNAAWGDARTDITEAVYAAYYQETAEAEIMQMDAGYI
jgi:CubicO group peptidase (beta-lactamase class C family)